MKRKFKLFSEFYPSKKISAKEKFLLFFKPMHSSRDDSIELFYKILNGKIYVLKEVIHEDHDKNN